jgi:arylsulfatase A
MRPGTFFVFIALFAVFCSASAEAAKPNFVIINIDDLGYADIGPYGSDNRTPHLDRMAAEGRLLTSHYAAPVCSPSRAALLTGCYPKRALPTPHVLFPAAAVGLHPDEVTIADALKQVGYATACIGKWHLGDQPEFLPTRQGFDYYFGIPYSNDMGPAADGAKSNPGKPLPDPDQAAAKAAAAKQQTDETGLKGFAQTPMPLLENETVVGRVRVEEQFAVTRLYTERAVRFIREHKERPFFLYLPHTAVHFPLYPAEPFMGKSPNGLIGDWAEEVDWSVGQVLDAIRELQLEANTFVLFTSDNGGALGHGSNNRPLRGGKGSTFEGGMRVCTIAWWPGKIPAGTRTDAITSMMDLLPTLTHLAGAELPDDRKLDGVDQWPVLAGTVDAAPPREQFYYFRGFRLEAVRSGPWKLHLALADGAAGRKKAPPRPQLFHLTDDIGETTDLASEHPKVVAELTALARTIEDDLGLDGIGPGCRPLGRVANPLPAIDHEGVVRPDMAGEVQRFP